VIVSAAARVRGAIFAGVTVLAILSSSCFASAEPLQVTAISASAETDARSGRPVLNIRLADESRKSFSAFSQDHVGLSIDMRIDGKNVVKTVIREPITGGVFHVTMDSIEEARRAADQLSRGDAKLEMEAASN
jgi:preprotein translocase subunit SecD